MWKILYLDQGDLIHFALKNKSYMDYLILWIAKHGIYQIYIILIQIKLFDDWALSHSSQSNAHVVIFLIYMSSLSNKC